MKLLDTATKNKGILIGAGAGVLVAPFADKLPSAVGLSTSTKWVGIGWNLIAAGLVLAIGGGRPQMAAGAAGVFVGRAAGSLFGLST